MARDISEAANRKAHESRVKARDRWRRLEWVEHTVGKLVWVGVALSYQMYEGMCWVESRVRRILQGKGSK